MPHLMERNSEENQIRTLPKRKTPQGVLASTKSLRERHMEELKCCENATVLHFSVPRLPANLLIIKHKHNGPWPTTCYYGCWGHVPDYHRKRSFRRRCGPPHWCAGSRSFGACARRNRHRLSPHRLG